MKNFKHAMLNVLRMLKQHGTDISRIKCTARKAAAIFVFAAFIACAATPALAGGLMKITDIQGGGGASVNDGAGGYKAQY
ncbi:MAG: hypothetical protein Q4E17_03070 [Synergistes sp.]|nr:hypothetical protein [Synergistes sp.]